MVCDPEKLKNGKRVIGAPDLIIEILSPATNKLYYILKCYLATQYEEEKYLLLADMEGDFMPNAQGKRIYRRIYGEPAAFNEAFVKSRHIMDYFKIFSHFLQVTGYQGWALLFDEAELIGRLGRKTRFKAYENMDAILRMNERHQTNIFAMFAFNASYVPDVIESKREWQALEAAHLDPSSKEAISSFHRQATSASTFSGWGGCGPTSCSRPANAPPRGESRGGRAGLLDCHGAYCGGGDVMRVA